ncbi:MAG: hypothetical protein ACE37F_32430 [Nannocystaceae bacterium]|nr:hypothetical protein [bacterium]
MLLVLQGPLAPTTPEVSVNLPPPPDPLGPIASVIGVLGLLLIASVLLRRLLRGRRGAATVLSLSVGVGNALMEVGAMLQPDRPKVVVVCKAKEASADGGLDPPLTPPTSARDA